MGNLFRHGRLDDVDDDNIASDINDDDTLALYNMSELQAACPDCKEIINYLCYGILPRDDAAACLVGSEMCIRDRYSFRHK